MGKAQVQRALTVAGPFLTFFYTVTSKNVHWYLKEIFLPALYIFFLIGPT